jgi:hypothetical protein
LTRCLATRWRRSRSGRSGLLLVDRRRPQLSAVGPAAETLTPLSDQTPDDEPGLRTAGTSAAACSEDAVPLCISSCMQYRPHRLYSYAYVIPRIHRVLRPVKTSEDSQRPMVIITFSLASHTSMYYILWCHLSTMHRRHPFCHPCCPMTTPLSRLARARPCPSHVAGVG